MSWYKTGQINITNGSQTVVGVGTNFARFVESGEALLAPDGKHYEIATVLSATELRLVSSYTGATASAQSYAIVPVQGYVRDLAYKAADLIDAHKSVPEEALAHAEASEQSALRAEAAKVGLEDAKTQAESSATAAATSKTSAASSATAAATSATNAATSATNAATSATNAATSATAAATSATAAANSATAASTSETNAASSATAAANSATAAATSKTAAATSESAALSSKNAAAASATAAATSETNAASSATAAAASKTAAESSASAANTSKIAAEASKTAAASSASSALASKNAAEAASSSALGYRDAAKLWADSPSGEIEPGKYSARYWAEMASNTVLGGVVYMGAWNATDGVFPSNPKIGHLYRVSTAGSVGGQSYSAGDSIIYGGASWDKIDSTDQVTTVAGRVGDIVLSKSDVGLGNVDNTSDANKPISTATQTALDTKVDKVAGKQLSTEDYTTAEKSKLSGVAAGANNYSHPEGDGNKHVPATGTTNNGKVLKAGSTAGSAAWGNVDYSEVTGKPVLGTAASRDVADLLAKMPVNISGATTDFNSLTLSGLYNLYNTQSATGAPPFSYGVMFVIGSNRVGSTFAAQIAIDKVTGDTYTRGQNDTSTDWSAWQKGWNSNNDGAGSGLDADLLDGQHGSFYQNASNLTTGTVPEPRIPALPISKITDLQTALNGKAAAYHGHTIADTSGLQAALDGKQAALGFTPVQQGGGGGQNWNKVFIGWATDGSGLLCQVDGTNFGKSWPINVTGTAATVINHYVSSAVRQVADIGAAYVNWDTAAPAVQVDAPRSDAAYMVWRATRWGGRHVAAMHVYEGSMTVTMSVGNLNNFIWDGNGNFTATGNVNALSDIRLKTDLTKIEGALEKVCAINGYTYTRKDTGARQTGVVAQEVQKVLPEAVIDNGEHLAVAYGNMVGLLIEAIKELKAEVDYLKGK